MEAWKINRAGLMNFWYYADEEFQFQDGRLLLRGSNGSGKSVTMQSLIPLLLDGNKRPERLDPFGTTARKMENYIVGEEYDQEERIAYLYLEFHKPELKKYATIGMGIKGKKNRPLDTWYFIITDDRRVGKDFFLYKEIGEKFCLTKKELENRLSDGGRVYDSQKAYMRGVNQHLFGYESIDDYDELIKLLVQLRSPKLSKDFKPTVIYEIMENALQTLTDEDLRPMSEAIEQMDSIKSQLDTLKENAKSIDKIKRIYDQYNRFMLISKAKELVDFHQNYKEREKEFKNDQQQLEDWNQQILEDTKTIRELEIQLKTYEEKEKTLKKNDFYVIQQELTSAQEKQAHVKKQQQELQEKYDDEKVRERELKSDITEFKSGLGIYKEDILTTLKDMDDVGENALFDEQAFLKDEFISHMEQQYSFQFIQTQVKQYRQKLQAANEALKREAYIREDYEKYLYQRDQKEREVKAQDVKIQEASDHYEEIKEEYIEKLHHWKNENKWLQIRSEKLNEIASMVRGFENLGMNKDLRQPILEVYETTRSNLLKEKSGLEFQRDNIQNTIDDKYAEINTWKKQKDPEPDMTKEKIQSREKLAEQGIPFLPLYKAIDFKEDIDDKLRGYIEEALVDMGLLNALIVPKQYEKDIRALGDDFCDKIIFTEPAFFQQELSKIFHIEKDTGHISAEQVDDVLKSILMDPTSHTYIGYDGQYRLGILGGRISGNYQPKYIGIKARRLYRERLILELQEQITELETEKNSVNEAIETIVKSLTYLEEEYHAFPEWNDVQVALDLLKQQREKANILKEQLEHLNETLLEKEQLLQEQRKQVRLLTEKIMLPKNPTAYQQAIEEMDSYQDLLSRLKENHHHYIKDLEMCQRIEDQYEHQLALLDDMHNRLIDLEMELRKLEQQITYYEEQLAKGEVKKLAMEMEECTRKLQELPKIIKDQSINKARVEERKEVLLQSLEQARHEIASNKVLLDMHIKKYKEEAALGYETLSQTDNYIKQAKDYLSINESLDKSYKSKEDYHQQLVKRFHENNGFLTEYHLGIINRFGNQVLDESINEKGQAILQARKRIDIQAKVEGKDIDFYELIHYVESKLEQHQLIFKESDRKLFQDILLSTVSKKIKARITHSEKWVYQMNQLMESMNTSSGLSFSLKWRSKKAETEEQLSTNVLVELLRRDSNLLTDQDQEKLSKHFRSKIEEAKMMMESDQHQSTFLSIVKEVLDYRKWFEFQLYYQKTGEGKKELTNRAFFTFSGGEKAMAMYVPLFSAVYARYEGARNDCPRLISLDEAFAGVDQKNIRDMFRLLVELDLSFIMNSQILWGDYDTVPSLAICDLQRPENARFVTVIRYLWNGKRKILQVDYDDIEAFTLQGDEKIE